MIPGFNQDGGGNIKLTQTFAFLTRQIYNKHNVVRLLFGKIMFAIRKNSFFIFLKNKKMQIKTLIN